MWGIVQLTSILHKAREYTGIEENLSQHYYFWDREKTIGFPCSFSSGIPLRGGLFAASLKSMLAQYDYITRQTEKEFCRVITSRTYEVAKQSGLY